MASKGGKHRSKKSSKKGSFKKTTGGTSFRNYSKKQKNLDYKYRIMDITDTNQQAWYSQAREAAKKIKDLLSDRFYQKYPKFNVKAFVDAVEDFAKDCTQSEAILINTACHFIPVSTSQLIAKNMTVEIRSRYPFAYCLFQNTKQFRDVFLRYMCGSMEGVRNETIWDTLRKAFVAIQNKSAEETEAFWNLYNQLIEPIYFNPFGLTDSGFVVNMLRSDCADYDQIADNASPTSAMWGQICRAQSSYREIRTANNAGEYYANVNAYYSKASTYLTTSTGKYGFTRGYTVGSIVASADEDSIDRNQFLPIQLVPGPTSANSPIPIAQTFSSISQNARTTNYDTVFNQGDMILCVLPTWFLNTVNPQATGQQARPHLDLSNVMTDIIPAVTIVRHYYILNQDVGIKEVEKNYTQAAYNVIVNNSTLANTVDANNIGNSLSVSQMVVRNLVNQSAGIRVQPLTRMDVDDLAQQTNCVIVDENCYDADNQELEMQAYMDLQPVPANVGDEVLNDVEGPDTMNCNAIVSCGNDSDPDKCFDATVTNTGPKLYVAANQSLELFNELSTYQYTNFGYGYAQLTNYLTYISQATTNVPYQYHYLMLDGSQHYNVDFDLIEKAVKFINQFVKFRCIIPKFTGGDTGGVFSFDSTSPNYHDFGFQPTGSTNETYLLAIIPFGFSYEDTSSDYYLEYLEPVLCVASDGESATNSVEITPTAYELVQQFYDKYFITTSASNSTMGKYSFAAVCGLKHDDDTDPEYGPVDGEYLNQSDMYQYLIQWMQVYQNMTNAGKVWKKIKGFFCKVVKFIKDRVCPLIKKVTDTVAPHVPAPYGTIISAVGGEVSLIQSALNLISAKKNDNVTSTAAVQDDTVVDKFYVTPQYRLSDSDTPADIAQEGTDWIDGDTMEVDATQYGNSVTGFHVHQLSQHPRFQEIRSRLRGTRVQGLDVGAYCQQRIKVVFKKTNVTPAIAKGYKAILALGADTTYLKDSDYQVVNSNQEIQQQ